MDKKIKLDDDLCLHKFYNLEPMEEYVYLAKKFLNKSDITNEDLDNLEYDIDFANFYEKNLSNNENLAKVIFKETFDIIESRETSKNADNSKEWLSRLKNLFDFDGEKSSLVYVLKKNNIPVSFALFSPLNEEEKRWNLELVYAHADFGANGYAEKLIEECFKEFNKNGEKEIVSIVERTNKASISLHQKLSNLCNSRSFIDEKTGNVVYDFDVQNLIVEHCF